MAIGTNYQEYVDALVKKAGDLDQAGLKGFLDWEAAVLTDGDVPAKTKKLIACALSVQAKCIGCIGLKAKAALEAGVTRQEFLEVMNVVMVMGGGPALPYATYALEAFEQFADTAQATG